MPRSMCGVHSPAATIRIKRELCVRNDLNLESASPGSRSIFQVLRLYFVSRSNNFRVDPGFVVRQAFVSAYRGGPSIPRWYYVTTKHTYEVSMWSFKIH